VGAKDFNISGLKKDFESRVRLGIMAILMVNEWVTFLEMKQLLELSDGNLASHSIALENRGYIEVRKGFIGKKTETAYRVTPYGKKAFLDHIDSLEKLLKTPN
jgi:DNA-binding MarR family transcriptional regulator